MYPTWLVINNVISEGAFRVWYCVLPYEKTFIFDLFRYLQHSQAFSHCLDCMSVLRCFSFLTCFNVRLYTWSQWFSWTSCLSLHRWFIWDWCRPSDVFSDHSWVLALSSFVKPVKSKTNHETGRLAALEYITNRAVLFPNFRFCQKNIVSKTLIFQINR